MFKQSIQLIVVCMATAMLHTCVANSQSQGQSSYWPTSWALAAPSNTYEESSDSLISEEEHPRLKELYSTFSGQDGMIALSEFLNSRPDLESIHSKWGQAIEFYVDNGILGIPTELSGDLAKHGILVDHGTPQDSLDQEIRKIEDEIEAEKKAAEEAEKKAQEEKDKNSEDEENSKDDDEEEVPDTQDEDEKEASDTEDGDEGSDTDEEDEKSEDEGEDSSSNEEDENGETEDEADKDSDGEESKDNTEDTKDQDTQGPQTATTSEKTDSDKGTVVSDVQDIQKPKESPKSTSVPVDSINQTINTPGPSQKFTIVNGVATPWVEPAKSLADQYTKGLSGGTWSRWVSPKGQNTAQTEDTSIAFGNR